MSNLWQEVAEQGRGMKSKRLATTTSHYMHASDDKTWQSAFGIASSQLIKRRYCNRRFFFTFWVHEHQKHLKGMHVRNCNTILALRKLSAYERSRSHYRVRNLSSAYENFCNYSKDQNGRIWLVFIDWQRYTFFNRSSYTQKLKVSQMLNHEAHFSKYDHWYNYHSWWGHSTCNVQWLVLQRLSSPASVWSGRQEVTWEIQAHQSRAKQWTTNVGFLASLQPDQRQDQRKTRKIQIKQAHQLQKTDLHYQW